MRTYSRWLPHASDTRPTATASWETLCLPSTPGSAPDAAGGVPCMRIERHRLHALRPRDSHAIEEESDRLGGLEWEGYFAWHQNISGRLSAPPLNSPGCQGLLTPASAHARTSPALGCRAARNMKVRAWVCMAPAPHIRSRTHDRIPRWPAVELRLTGRRPNARPQFP